MINKKSLFFLGFVLFSTSSWATTGWYCGSCSNGDPAAMDVGCEPCDRFCHYCAATNTSKSLAITGGTRYWTESCTDDPVYCVNGVPSVCTEY